MIVLPQGNESRMSAHEGRCRSLYSLRRREYGLANRFRICGECISMWELSLNEELDW